jgi:exodeoxyribonuclease VII large subunit
MKCFGVQEVYFRMFVIGKKQPMPHPNMEPLTTPPYVTLLEISKEIQSAILQRMNQFYWIRAEIAKLNFYRQSGHCYPQLVEKKEQQVLAEMRATIWAGDYRAIQQKFRKIAGTELTEGMTILCHARVNYHPLYGLSLQIADIDPSFTLGEMAQERTKTINRLKVEGLWDRNREVEIPLLPQRLAIISVDTSKGYHDFRNIIDQNSWGYAFFHMLFPALLQGDKAVESISRQLDLIATVHHHFDAVLIIRGGGGDVGLNCFDHYELASRVAKFPIPVISGIGHSTNETIVEMVSHTNSITPTDVAYMLLQHYHNFSVKLEERARIVKEWPEQILTQERRHLAEVSMRFASGARLYTERNQARLHRLATLITANPMQKLRRQQERVLSMVMRMGQAVKVDVKRRHDRLTSYEQHTRLLDPLNILKRGYSITRLNGKAVKHAGELQPDDVLQITLSKGVVETIVINKTPEL